MEKRNPAPESRQVDSRSTLATESPESRLFFRDIFIFVHLSSFPRPSFHDATEKRKIALQLRRTPESRLFSRVIFILRSSLPPPTMGAEEREISSRLHRIEQQDFIRRNEIESVTAYFRVENHKSCVCFNNSVISLNVHEEKCRGRSPSFSSAFNIRSLKYESNAHT